MSALRPLLADGTRRLALPLLWEGDAAWLRDPKFKRLFESGPSEIQRPLYDVQAGRTIGVV